MKILGWDQSEEFQSVWLENEKFLIDDDGLSMAVLVDRWRDAISLSLQKMEQKNWDRKITRYLKKKKKKKDWGRGADISATEFQKVIIFSPNLLAHWFQQPLM